MVRSGCESAPYRAAAFVAPVCAFEKGSVPTEKCPDMFQSQGRTFVGTMSNQALSQLFYCCSPATSNT